MTVIAALDIATLCGVAIYDTKRHLSAIMTGTINVGAADDDESAIWERSGIGEEIVKLRNQAKELFGQSIDFVVIEAKANLPIGRAVASWGNSSELHGAVCSHLRTMKIPFGTVMPSRWRSAAFPTGFKPPVIQVKKAGKVEDKNDWKTAAVEKCIELGIQLPERKSHGREDAAEAALMALVWHRATAHGPIGKEAFERLLKSRHMKEAA